MLSLEILPGLDTRYSIENSEDVTAEMNARYNELLDIVLDQTIHSNV